MCLPTCVLGGACFAYPPPYERSCLHAAVQEDETTKRFAVLVDSRGHLWIAEPSTLELLPDEHGLASNRRTASERTATPVAWPAPTTGGDDQEERLKEDSTTPPETEEIPSCESEICTSAAISPQKIPTSTDEV